MMAAHTQENSPLPSDISSWFTSLVYPVASRILLPLYFDQVRITGAHFFPENAPLIIAPTHRSRWDGLVVGHALGRPSTGRDLRYMVSVNEMGGLQGWIIRQFGGFAIDPDAPTISVLRHGVNLLLNEQALVIFGEGDIFHDRAVDYIKPGLARIALQAQKKAIRQHQPKPIRILPVGLYYSNAHPRKGGTVEVKLAPSLNVCDYLNTSTKEAAQRITVDLKSSLNHLMLSEPPLALSQVSA
jgi:1-acyl-sn-glycerol-3-phosphate acyltransferase